MMVFNPDEVEKDFTDEEIFELMKGGSEMEEEKLENKYDSITLEKIQIGEGYGGHEKAGRHFFSNKTMWTSKFKEVATSLKLLSFCEEEKYIKKSGKRKQGRNMFFLAYLYPLYKKYLEKHGFKINHNDLDFARNTTLKYSDPELNKFIESIEKMDEELNKLETQKNEIKNI